MGAGGQPTHHVSHDRAYRAEGTVSVVEPRTRGRRKDLFALDREREQLIGCAIRKIY